MLPRLEQLGHAHFGAAATPHPPLDDAAIRAALTTADGRRPTLRAGSARSAAWRLLRGDLRTTLPADTPVLPSSGKQLALPGRRRAAAPPRARPA